MEEKILQAIKCLRNDFNQKFDDIGYDLNFSLNVYEAQYFNHLATIHAPFVENVLREGKTLWTRGSLIRRFLKI